MGLIVPK